MAQGICMLMLLISDGLGSLGSSQELEQCQTTTASVSLVLGHMVYHLCIDLLGFYLMEVQVLCHSSACIWLCTTDHLKMVA